MSDEETMKMNATGADYVKLGKLDVARELYDLVKDEIAPGTGVDVEHFWNSLAAIVNDLGPRNTELLSVRDELQVYVVETFWPKSCLI